MTLVHVTLVYLGAGVVCGFVAIRRGRGVLDATLSILAWPLYAPALVAEPPPIPTPDEPRALATRVRAALAGVREAADGSPFASLLGAAAEARLLAELERAEARMRAIDRELAEVSGGGGSSGAASLRAESVASLTRLRASDAAAMAELAELLGALRARIVLARHAGSSAEGPAALVSEVWARVEGLGEAVAGAP